MIYAVANCPVEIGQDRYPKGADLCLTREQYASLRRHSAVTIVRVECENPQTRAVMVNLKGVANE